MISAYTGSTIRKAEAPFLEAGQGALLMRRAAYGLYSHAVDMILERRSVYGSAVVVLAGSGNNAGDALYAGARLAGRGARTTAVLTSARTHSGALAEFVRQGGHVLRLIGDRSEAAGESTRGDGDGAAEGTVSESTGESALSICLRADLILDGILGTGASGGLRQPARSLVEALDTKANEQDQAPLILACDLPSGVDADTGEVHGPVLHAHVTVAFGGAKSGLMAGPGAQAAGELYVVDIGLGSAGERAGGGRPGANKERGTGNPDVHRLEISDIATLYPVPGPEDHKYTRGVLGISAGSGQYPGAALLAAGGALATGVGMVRYLGPDAVADILNVLHPEVVCSNGAVSDSHVQAWLVGPGIGADPDQVQRAREAIKSGLPVVADASALSVLNFPVRPNVILTPHAGELSALFQRLGSNVTSAQVQASPLTYAREAARQTQATVLLKGHATIIAAPDGTTFSQAATSSWLAAAGSGDTLAGILGALTATLADSADLADKLASKGLGSRQGLSKNSRWAVIAALAALIHGQAGRLAAEAGPLSPSGLPRYVRRFLRGAL